MFMRGHIAKDLRSWALLSSNADLSFPSVTFGELHHLSVPQFLHL